LSGRDLRYADFSGSRLPKVDFVGADDKPSDLSYANFSYAMLVDARMRRTKFQGAHLLGAQLQGAGLRMANLQGANLQEAKLQGTDLIYAEFRGADLSGAQLQGARLRRMNLGYSNISGASFGSLAQSALKTLQATMAESIQDDQLLKRINDTLIHRAKEQTTISQAKGKDVWDNDSSRLSKYGFSDALEIAKDKPDYLNKLAAYWIELSCQNQWTATSIIRTRMEYSFDGKPTLLASSFAQCLLSLKDQKNKAGQLVCPALSEIDEKTVAILEEMAASENTDSSIQSTFACQTERSDQKQPSE